MEGKAIFYIFYLFIFEKKGKPKQRFVYLDDKQGKIYLNNVDKKNQTSRFISLPEF